MKKIFFIILLLAVASECMAVEPRIVSLAPSITEILFTLGLEDLIVGVDEYSNYPEEAKGIERVGTFLIPDIEKIILLKPDYILVHSVEPVDRTYYLKNLGIKIIEISPKDVDGICKGVKMLGDVFGRKKEADLVVSDIKRRLKAVSGKIGSNRPKVFVQLFNDPLITVSSFIGDVIELAGGDNIAWDVKKDSGIFSYEILIDRDPDVVIIAGFSEEDNLPDSISAKKNNRVYGDLDLDMLLRPGPRVIDSIEELNRMFYEKD